jgi:hypothetical protein
VISTSPTNEEEVLYFISQFAPARDLFLNGMCYWFAQILHQRFPVNSIIMYDEIINHFACKIETGIYDASGEVSTKYNWKPLYETDAYKDESEWNRIIRDCIKKERVKE